MNISSLTRKSLASSIVIAAVLVLTVGCAPTPSSGSTSKPIATGPAASNAPRGQFSTCLRTDAHCLGPLASGSYESEHFTTFPTRSPGQLTYSVKDGYWANALDQRPAYWFNPAKEYAAGTGDENLPGVFVWGDASGATQNFPTCPETADPKSPTDAEGLLSWLAHLPGLTATPIADLQLGDHKALGLDLVVDPTTASSCPWGKFVPLIGSNGPDPYMTGINAGERAQVYLVDLGNGHSAAVIVTAPADKFAAVLPHAAALISSFRFVAP
jgi:hypothetical protein